MIKYENSEYRSLYLSGPEMKGAGRMGRWLKLVYLVIGVVCLMLGVIGLIIPIIPGVLFLMVALYLLSRGSHRIKSFSERQPHLRRLHRRMEQFGKANFSGGYHLKSWGAK